TFVWCHLCRSTAHPIPLLELRHGQCRCGCREPSPVHARPVCCRELAPLHCNSGIQSANGTTTI
ncbi:hypothetical protein CPC16_011948, partial [Podila verticillata]